MIKSITRETVGDVSDAVTEVSGFGSDVGTLDTDLRQAFAHLGQEEGDGLIIRAGSLVLGTLGLRSVRESQRWEVNPVRYCGALVFWDMSSPGSADWWRVSRDAPASSDASAAPKQEETPGAVWMADEQKGGFAPIPGLEELAAAAKAASTKARGEGFMDALKTESIRRQVEGWGNDRPRDTPVQLIHEVGYISFPPNTNKIKQGLQKAFADMGSPLGDDLVISAYPSVVKAMLDLNLLKWGTRLPVQTLSPRDDFGGSRYFLNARVVKDHALGADIWRVAIDCGQEDTPLVSEGVAAAGVSAGEAIEQLQREEASTAEVGASIGAAIEILQEWDGPFHPQGLSPIPGNTLPSERRAEVMIRTYEGLISRDTMATTVRDRVKRHLMNWTETPGADLRPPALSVQEALARIAKEDEAELAAAHEKQESDYEDMTRLLTREPDPALVAALGETAPDGEPADPRAGPAAMLRADLRLLITSAREQNAREGVKCRELSVAITNLETAYLWIGEMSAGEGHSLDFNK